MCADWSIHDKGMAIPHVHLLLTMRPFNGSFLGKKVKDWGFLCEIKAEKHIVIDESHPDWWQG